MLTLRSAGPSRVTSRPPIQMLPALGASSPAIMRKVVVLPQPLGPSSVVSVPGAISKLTSRTASGRGGRVAIALADAAQLDAGGGGAVAATIAGRAHRVTASPTRRRPRRRSPTSHWIATTASDISRISTVQ